MGGRVRAYVVAEADRKVALERYRQAVDELVGANGNRRGR
jgi:hypothetical protein